MYHKFVYSTENGEAKQDTNGGGDEAQNNNTDFKIYNDSSGSEPKSSKLGRQEYDQLSSKMKQSTRNMMIGDDESGLDASFKKSFEES